MALIKQPFYIIGHNPNSIEEAHHFLRQGANALEPDIVHANGKFYVSHLPHISYEGVPTVQEYLQQLKTLLLKHQYPLALIIWDIKDNDFNINDFIQLVKAFFSGEPFDGIAMLMTHSDDDGFLNRYQRNYANIGVGVDESNTPATELEKIFLSAGQHNFSYADGITGVLNKTGIQKNLTDAQQCRDTHTGRHFSLVYAWVISLESSMRSYLNTCIDGIMVDIAAVETLTILLASAPYSEVYTLAVPGYNPFTVVPPPRYTLRIKTADKFLAGTDALFRFTLQGTKGDSLTSLPYDAGIKGALEKGSITLVTLRGEDIGEIASITIEAISAGPASAWLPESIEVESELLTAPARFEFSKDGHEEWITKKTGALTKMVAG
jgi:hypothetical protein